MLNAVFRMDGGAPDTERTLGFHLNSRTAFADYSVAAIGRVGDGAEGTDDTACWWSISGRPVTDDRGRFVGFIGSGSDLTEKRRSDAEITRMEIGRASCWDSVCQYGENSVVAVSL